MEPSPRAELCSEQSGLWETREEYIGEIFIIQQQNVKNHLTAEEIDIYFLCAICISFV